MAWKVTTAPTVEPVSLTEAKLHLRVDHSTDDDLITALIKAAREYCEGFQNRAYTTQTITMTLDVFPDEFIVPVPPLQSVTSIKYYNTSNVQQTLAAAAYTVDTQSTPGRIVASYGYTWPSTYDKINAVEVIFKAGYGDAAASVPETIKAAIKLLVGHLYERREETIFGTIIANIPLGITSLLHMERVF